jgi:hypothetical protein
MSATRIATAADACFAYAIKFESAVPAVADFIAVLKLSDGWTVDELAEVHRRVVESLAKRASDARARFEEEMRR